MGHPQTRTQTGSPPNNENLTTIIQVRLFHRVDVESFSQRLYPTILSGGTHAARSRKGLRPHRQEPPTTHSQGPGASPPAVHIPGEQGSERLREPRPQLPDESRRQSKPGRNQRKPSRLRQLCLWS